MQRRNIFIILLIGICIGVSAQQEPKIDLNKKWRAVIEAIEQVESEGRTNAVSRNKKWVGCLQISEVLVRQCNQIVGYEKYSYNDRYSREKSHEMFIVYQEYFNKEGNMEKAIRLWNSGDLRCMTRKSRTESYYRRVMDKFNQMAKN